MPLLRLAELPLELLYCVAENADIGSSLSLCQTDRRTHGVCLRWIYRNLLLEDPVRAIGCLRTVISDAEAAHAVRILVIRVEKLSLLRRSTVCSRLRFVATNLKLLDIYTRPELFAAARDIHFRRLRRVSIPFCADIIPFLQLHQNLVELSVTPFRMHPSLPGAPHSIQSPFRVSKSSAVPRSSRNPCFVARAPHTYHRILEPSAPSRVH
ncbi:hypothetical protein B0H15DRAFT_168857 [Mycena belliarum]|uniref:F-box domain-containing protein n=1 Tax=Mycena belliarum TaxID=1033014 RepID=A0AAD6UBQ3_9AGAR|nr:hypothetical protein B0H15DRAFT_168857 [Mycena belliae]